jgi:short-subunit dehydrogenase
MKTDKRFALVTGASSGIGMTFARRLAKEGYGLILVARRRERLEALARELGGAEVLAADLTQDSDLKLVEDRIDAAPNLELLVNNAGFGTKGRFFEAPIDGQDTMHRLHVLATMRLTHAALRGMVLRDHGAVIQVSSVAGFAQSPGNTSYCATKAWMNSFTEGLYLDLRSRGSRVVVQSLCPGFTMSEFHDVMGAGRERIPPRLWLQAEDVVEASLRGLKGGKLYVIPGRFYRVMTAVQRWVPRPVRFALALRYARAMKRTV